MPRLSSQLCCLACPLPPRVQVEAAAEARQQEYEARKREQAVQARLVLEEQIAEKQVGGGSSAWKRSG